MKTAFIQFDSVKTELQTGINLIEASAGTGKTYAIAMLVLRFVVEQGVDIQKILVLTFTKAATEELKNRIRKRLLEARQALINKDKGKDSTDNNDALKLWLNDLSIEPQLAIQRLNLALFDIDQASIFTIHGFCQRVLSDYALQSGQLFDSELTGDISAIKQACTDDFWRKHIYPLSAWEASFLTADYTTPEQLQASVDFIADDIKVFPEYENLIDKLSELKKLVNDNKAAINTSLQAIKRILPEGKFKKTFVDDFEENSQNLLNWLNTVPCPAIDFSIFTPSGLSQALNGNKFRTSQKNPLPSDQQKTRYIQSIGLELHPFAVIDSAITSVKLYLRRSLLQTLREDLDKRLEQLNLLSFDHLISRLDYVLKHEQGLALCEEMRQCYRVVLIDEFQDTDEKQWNITATLFHTTKHYLYLIGDPKQAIYKFRGADINTYFAAQQQRQRGFTLSQNWRSHPNLVTGVNSLFKKPKAFYSEQLNFYPVQSGLTAAEGEISYCNKPIPPLVLWQLAQGKSEYWSAGKAADEIQRAVVNEILHVLSTDFIIQKSDNKNPILAKDIAILVRSNAQAQAFQEALNEAGIVAVINSKISVFSSKEATDLYILLQAIAQAGDNTLIKQALALSWFKLNGQQLFSVINTETEYDAWCLRFQDYHQEWQKKGLMAMMRHLMQHEKVAVNLAKTPQAERKITNIQHLLELLQQAVIEKHLGINKTLNWLARNITETRPDNTTSNEQQLRLESDEDAVQIMTMHSAKGLQFAIVFCPFLWQRGTKLKKEKQLITCFKNQQMIADLGTDQFELHRLLALEEELAEDIRVFYVAVTRAEYRCYINWANVRTKGKANDSAMAYLLDCAEGDFLAQQACLQTYTKNQPEAIEYRLLPAEQTLNDVYHKRQINPHLTSKQRKRSLYTSWQMSSYTSLSSLSLADISETAEIPRDKAREEQTITVTERIQNELPRGAHTGNVIHDLLENIAFQKLANNSDISEQRDQSCLRYGLKADSPEQLDLLLNHTVSTFLTTDNASFNLKQLAQQQCLKEMPFYLAVKSFNANQINLILSDCPTYQELSKKTISGYLTGFIDLICEYQGQYYVMDYKSNYLECYDQEFLIQAMREHNYGLQYWIYSLVLHLYLQKRVVNYSYEKHFGGIKYLFVRGMNKDWENSGVYQTKPELVKIQQLLAQLLPDPF